MKYIYKILLSILSIFFIGSACSDTEEAIVMYGTLTTSYSLSGTVKNADGDPLKNIKVLFNSSLYPLESNAVNTDINGVFTITNVENANINNFDKNLKIKLTPPPSSICPDLNETKTNPCYITAIDTDGDLNGGFFKVQSVFVTPTLDNDTGVIKQDNIEITLELK